MVFLWVLIYHSRNHHSCKGKFMHFILLDPRGKRFVRKESHELTTGIFLRFFSPRIFGGVFFEVAWHFCCHLFYMAVNNPRNHHLSRLFFWWTLCSQELSWPLFAVLDSKILGDLLRFFLGKKINNKTLLAQWRYGISPKPQWLIATEKSNINPAEKIQHFDLSRCKCPVGKRCNKMSIII